jgi:hypothetical protein
MKHLYKSERPAPTPSRNETRNAPAVSKWSSFLPKDKIPMPKRPPRQPAISYLLQEIEGQKRLIQAHEAESKAAERELQAASGLIQAQDKVIEAWERLFERLKQDYPEAWKALMEIPPAES